jgi:hypothetical protein
LLLIRSLVRFSVIIILLSLISCSWHTVDLGGVGHVEGFGEPVQNCSECHGGDLQGTDEAPTCFSCHDQKWE